ncbi:hypothetical protein EV426DRAFT_702053 [Tirmania nivea]|nr:hypothetical protein EV426DRAFT_702053 [Tirmania nivea]
MRQACSPCYKTELIEWAPIPHTSLTALRDPHARADRVYYQGLNGIVYGIVEEYDKPLVPMPPFVRGGTLGTLAPLAVIDAAGAVGPGPNLKGTLDPEQLFYLDTNAILTKATLKHVEEYPIPVEIDTIDWLNVQANRASKLAAIAVPLSNDGQSHAHSGGEKAIRELWIRTTRTTPGTDDNLTRQSQDLRYTIFTSQEILMGTSLASNVLWLKGHPNAVGAFYYQRQDETEVVKPKNAAFHTALAVAYSTMMQTEFLFFISVDGKICELRIDVRLPAARVYGARYIIYDPQYPPLGGTSLAATAIDDCETCSVHLYYQDTNGCIQRLFSGKFEGESGCCELVSI